MNRPLTQYAERHLTDEQMFALLDSAPKDEPVEAASNLSLHLHLRTCAHCQHELTMLRAALGNFREAATAFAAAEMPRLVARPAAPRTAYRFRRQAWAASFATAAAALAISLTVFHPHREAAPVVSANHAAVADAVSDEALLDGIQRDLSTSVPPPLEPLEVASAATSSPN